MPKFTELIDTFDTGLSLANWPRVGPYAGWDSVRKCASINANGLYMSGTNLGFIESQPIYDLTSVACYARFQFDPNIGSNGTVSFFLVRDRQNWIGMNVDSGLISGYKLVAPGGSTYAFSITYVPATHGPWWRIREQGGSIVFDCSTDGRTWLSLGSVANPSWSLVGLSMRVEVGDYNNSTPPGPYQVLVDNVNSVVPGIMPQWARLTGPKGDRPNPYFFSTAGGATNWPAGSSSPITLTSPHIRYDTSWTDPRVYRTWQGICFMEGLIRRSDNAGIANGTVVGVIPVGWCPPGRSIMQSVCSGDGTNCRARVDVDPNGNITLQDIGAGSAVWLSLTGFWPLDPTWHT